MRSGLRSLRLVATSGLLATGCATGTASQLPAPGPVLAPFAPGAAAAERPGVRWAARPLPVSRAFQAAIASGTRTESGAPGRNYWTQEVDYDIRAELDPETTTLQGSETITYRNRSPEPLGVLILHLYQNLFSEGADRTRTVPITGGMTIERVELGGRELSRVQTPQRGGYLVLGTLMAVYPDAAIPVQGSAELDIDWSFVVPPEGAPRMGHIDRELFNVGQWYPQAAVYDDLEGWHTWPYLGNGEFYLEYGDFDVAITVPEGWLVGATGSLQNGDEVFPGTILDRLDRALVSDEVVQVVGESERGAGTATRTDPTGTLTWRFRAEGVRDFAFATSSEYVWDATRAITPDANGDGQDEVVAVHALYRPTVDSWSESAEYVRHAVTFHAERWHPYPWPQMTGAEGPVGGMEYPMLTFVRAFPEARTVYETLNHEIGHMWYPMMIGSNEPSYAWMDEGLTTYIEGYATGDYFDEPEYWRTDQNAYLSVAGEDFETPSMRHADLHGPNGTYPFASYWKPATMLKTLEALIGQDTVWEALREYTDRWMYRHPDPLDFFNTVESVAGRDLDWFWHPFWYETAYLDHAIEDVQMGQGAAGAPVARVTVMDLGSAPLPATIELELSGGQTLVETIPVEVWLEGATRHTLTVSLPAGATVERAEIDPDELFPDVDRDNNAWEG